MLSFLPLHAAGDYSSDNLGSKLTDYATLTYIPSLKALIHAIDSLPALNQKLQILAVAQPSIKGHQSLPGVLDELHCISEWKSEQIEVSTLTGSEVTTQKVKEEMTRVDWVHFACHGVQNIHEPNESALLIADTSQLTLSDIIKLNPHSKGLAFLSACQTATGDEVLADEALHLAAGMLFSGYQGVIATMWSIADRDAPLVARDVYNHLLTDPQPDVQKAADALHYAVSNLQASSPKSFLSWVPFIHIGI
jgi:CHAT domain-containing protein